jgi:flagellar assembly protein FliH
MHPADVTAMGDQVQLLIAGLSSLGKAKVVSDAQITLGGCRIETKFGAIDQQFETQLARIEAELTY